MSEAFEGKLEEYNVKESEITKELKDLCVIEGKDDLNTLNSGFVKDICTLESLRQKAGDLNLKMKDDLLTSIGKRKKKEPYNNEIKDADRKFMNLCLNKKPGIISTNIILLVSIVLIFLASYICLNSIDTLMSRDYQIWFFYNELEQYCNKYCNKNEQDQDKLKEYLVKNGILSENSKNRKVKLNYSINCNPEELKKVMGEDIEVLKTSSEDLKAQLIDIIKKMEVIYANRGLREGEPTTVTEDFENDLRNKSLNEYLSYYESRKEQIRRDVLSVPINTPINEKVKEYKTEYPKIDKEIYKSKTYIEKVNDLIVLQESMADMPLIYLETQQQGAKRRELLYGVIIGALIGGILNLLFKLEESKDEVLSDSISLLSDCILNVVASIIITFVFFIFVSWNPGEIINTKSSFLAGDKIYNLYYLVAVFCGFSIKNSRTIIDNVLSFCRKFIDSIKPTA